MQFLELGAHESLPESDGLRFTAASRMHLARDWEPPSLLFCIANNTHVGAFADMAEWYDQVHVQHTFEYFGFTFAQRFTAVSAGRFEHLVIYGVGSTPAEAMARMDWAAADRVIARDEGREPVVPVPEVFRPPRYADFYSPVDWPIHHLDSRHREAELCAKPNEPQVGLTLGDGTTVD